MNRRSLYHYLPEEYFHLYKKPKLGSCQCGPVDFGNFEDK